MVTGNGERGKILICFLKRYIIFISNKKRLLVMGESLSLAVREQDAPATEIN